MKLATRRDEPHRSGTICQEQPVVKGLDPPIPTFARDRERLYGNIVEVGLDDFPPYCCTHELPYLITLAEGNGSSEEGDA